MYVNWFYGVQKNTVPYHTFMDTEWCKIPLEDQFEGSVIRCKFMSTINK